MDGLNPARLVDVTVNLSPQAVPRGTFGVLLILGDSNVIDTSERLRSYTEIESVADDFGTSAPEYLSALRFFSQTPRPLECMIGRWARTATAALLKGKLIAAADQAALYATLHAIDDGTLKITVDGVVKNLTALDLTGAASLSAIATVIDTALTGATVVWEDNRFKVTSGTTGATSTLTYAEDQGTGTDLSPILKLDEANANAPIDGIAAEAAVDAVTLLVDRSGHWYGGTFACGTNPTDDALVAVAAYIQAASPARIWGFTVTDTDALDSQVTDDLGSRLAEAGYSRSCWQYSADKHAIASLMARAFSTDFTAQNSMITLMFKQEPGVLPEEITESQAQAIKAKHGNVYVKYANGTAIIQDALMASGLFFDVRHGSDWQANAVQTELWNALYTTPTKVSQTEVGQEVLKAVVVKAMQDGVNNGLLYPGGIWNAPGFGTLKQGDPLPAGFYVYALPISQQSQSIRETRKAPPFQIAAKFAGAIHGVDGVITVNQ